FSSRRRHTRFSRDWSSDVCSSDLTLALRDINRAVPPRQLVDDLVWEGNLDFKLDIEREADDTDELKIKGDTRIEHGPWRHLLKGELEDKRKNDAQTKDN